MKAILFLNIIAVILGASLPNDFLMWHSYVLYGFQALTMLPFLVRKAVFVKNLFLPTFFVLFYFLVNLTLGSYLVPRDFGWNKEFADVVVQIRNYNLIVPFFLLSNIILFVLTDSVYRKLRVFDHAPLQNERHVHSSGSLLAGAGRSVFYFVAFLLFSYFQVYSVFSFQLALLLLQLTDPWLRRSRLRYVAYVGYLLVLVAFSFENKREIAIALFLMLFLETYFQRSLIRYRLRSIAGYVLAAVGFFGLILAASILRGYGDFPVATVVEAVRYIPQYMSSDMFVDGVTDNLELNYNYGVAVTAINHGITGLIDYQYGLSLFKLFFLPIPRDWLPWKPESIMQIFTQEYAPQWWAEEGSMPVILPSEAFLNFHYLGLLQYALIWLVINHLFIVFHRTSPRSFVSYSCAFLFITVLTFARGSGIEQYVLYYLIAAPVFLLGMLLRQGMRARSAPALLGEVHA